MVIRKRDDEVVSLAHACQAIQISRYSAVVEVSLNHAIQPLAHNGDGFMPSSHQFCPDRFESRSHSLLHRQANDLESALPVSATTVRESVAAGLNLH